MRDLTERSSRAGVDQVAFGPGQSDKSLQRLADGVTIGTLLVAGGIRRRLCWSDHRGRSGRRSDKRQKPAALHDPLPRGTALFAPEAPRHHCPVIWLKLK